MLKHINEAVNLGTSALLFDTETTSKDFKEIIEAAYVETAIHSGNLLCGESYEERFKPRSTISPAASAVHHIVASDLLHCRPSADFKLPEDVQYLIGQNIDFDWKAIVMTAEDPSILVQPKLIDTLPIFKALYKEADAHNLSAMAYLLFGEAARDTLKHAHNAKTDVLVMAAVLDKAISRINQLDFDALPAHLSDFNKVTSIETLYQLSEKLRIPKVMPFGKHKDVPFSKIPNDYKVWMIKEWIKTPLETDSYLLKAMVGNDTGLAILAKQHEELRAKAYADFLAEEQAKILASQAPQALFATEEAAAATDENLLEPLTDDPEFSQVQKTALEAEVEKMAEHSEAMAEVKAESNAEVSNSAVTQEPAKPEAKEEVVQVKVMQKGLF